MVHLIIDEKELSNLIEKEKKMVLPLSHLNRTKDNQAKRQIQVIF